MAEELKKIQIRNMTKATFAANKGQLLLNEPVYISDAGTNECKFYAGTGNSTTGAIPLDTVPKKALVRLTQSNAQAISSKQPDDAWEALQFGNREFGGDLAGADSSITSQYLNGNTGVTVPTGFSLAIVTGTIEFNMNNIGVRCAGFYKDGTVIARSAVSANTYPSRLCMASVVPVTTGDTISFTVWQNCGSSLNTTAGITQMSVLLL